LLIGTTQAEEQDKKKVHTTFFFRKDVKILVVTLLQKTSLVAGKTGFQRQSAQPLQCHRQ
jgi:hypothetical protein